MIYNLAVPKFIRKGECTPCSCKVQNCCKDKICIIASAPVTLVEPELLQYSGGRRLKFCFRTLAQRDVRNAHAQKILEVAGW